MTSRDLKEPIIESLYSHALLLADEARVMFEPTEPANLGEVDNAMRVALSIEGLRTTTRVMHVLAWLLNQRAYLSGDLSENQLRRHGALPVERPSDPKQLMMLPPDVRSFIRETERLHSRVMRLDGDWRNESSDDRAPVQAMQGRIAAAFDER